MTIIKENKALIRELHMCSVNSPTFIIIIIIITISRTSLDLLLGVFTPVFDLDFLADIYSS